MQTIAGKLYQGGVVAMDDKRFVDCVFDSTILEYHGGGIILDGCDLRGARWEFKGKASNTINLLISLSKGEHTAQYIRGTFPHLFKE